MSQKQAPGFAAALDRLMAQGGDRKATRKGFTYSQGRLKGKTQDQAVQMGRDMWANAPDAVKEKYASRSRGMQAPSERSGSPMATAAPAVASRGGQSSAPRYAGPAPAPASPTFADLTKAPALPAEIQSVGDGSTAANGFTPQARIAGMPASEVFTPEVMSGKFKPQVTDGSGPAPVAAAAPAVSPPAYSGPVATPQKGRNPSDEAYATIADQRKATNYPEATRAVPFTGADVTKAQDAGFGANPTPTGATPGKAARVNPLTGLPFGYRPGDALPEGASAGMQGAATASVGRQQAATAAYQGPIPKATLAPAADRYTDAQNQYQGSKQDPKFAAKMDGIYKGANSVDQARITANSLKRAKSLI